MDELVLTLVAALINGISLMFGLIIGTRLTGNTLEKMIRKVMKDSKTLQKVEGVLVKLDKILGDENVINEVTKFFKEASKLVTSPEAKQFFKNAAELMKEFSSKDDTKLNLPEKKVKK